MTATSTSVVTNSAGPWRDPSLHKYHGTWFATLSQNLVRLWGGGKDDSWYRTKKSSQIGAKAWLPQNLAERKRIWIGWKTKAGRFKSSVELTGFSGDCARLAL